VRRRLVTVGFVALGLVLLVGLGLLAVYWGSQHVPAFYRQALAGDPKAAEEASGRMIEQAAALASHVEKGGRWEAVFTAEEINGWLAVDMERNYPDLLPPSLSDPRVDIQPEGVWIACRLDRGNMTSVVSLGADLYLARPNVVALRIRQARAGVLPLPLDTVLDKISEQADELDLQIAWLQTEGDPVVEITLPPPRSEDDKAIQIEAIRLGQGKIYLSGSSD
jgi:hypothetical protein